MLPPKSPPDLHRQQLILGNKAEVAWRKDEPLPASVPNYEDVASCLNRSPQSGAALALPKPLNEICPLQMTEIVLALHTVNGDLADLRIAANEPEVQAISGQNGSNLCFVRGSTT